MTRYHFTVVLASEPDEAQTDHFYSLIDDGIIGCPSGEPCVHFHREAASLEEAIRSATHDISTAGGVIEQIRQFEASHG